MMRPFISRPTLDSQLRYQLVQAKDVSVLPADINTPHQNIATSVSSASVKVLRMFAPRNLPRCSSGSPVRASLHEATIVCSEFWQHRKIKFFTRAAASHGGSVHCVWPQPKGMILENKKNTPSFPA